nr:YbhB/YbcL family Raf kinase inhibitor-like protein [Hartmannibacter diazotrophicus]
MHLAAALLLSVAPAQAGSLTLMSPTVKEGVTLPLAQVLDGFGCEGENRSPALSWSGAPDGTKSYAVTLYDPDAPTGSGFWHWVLVDLPPATDHLDEGAGAASGKDLPAGARQLRDDFGVNVYGGACPPPGDGMHRYVFTVRALDVPSLPVPDDASGALAGFVLNQHTLASAKITAAYARP